MGYLIGAAKTPFTDRLEKQLVSDVVHQGFDASMQVIADAGHDGKHLLSLFAHEP